MPGREATTALPSGRKKTKNSDLWYTSVMLPRRRARSHPGVRITVLALWLLGLGLAAVALPQPAFSAPPAKASASGCTFPPDAEVYSKTWLLNQRDPHTTIYWHRGKVLSPDQFFSDLDGAKRYSNDLAPTQAWWKSYGDRSYTVDFRQNGCRALATVEYDTGSHLWTYVCVAPVDRQVHTRCLWNLPEHSAGMLWTGEYNPSTGMIGGNDTGTFITTS